MNTESHQSQRPVTQEVTEAELVTAAVAPRVTEEEVEANIRSEHYFTAADGVRGEANAQQEVAGPYPQSLDLLTFCVLVLQNGFTVVGQSACASPMNYNKDIGQALARKDAKGQIWAYMGYELRSQLVSGN